MNPSQEQTATNVFIEGELSEEDLMKMAGGVISANVDVLGVTAKTSFNPYI